jgi:membrane dipeptidase
MLSKTSIAVACALLAVTCQVPWGGVPYDETPEQRARRVHTEAIVIDTHSDTTPFFEDPEWDFGARHEDGHMDLPRIREGGLDAVFFSIWMGATEGDGKAVKTALQRIDSVHQAAQRWSDDVTLARTAAEVRAAARAGKVAALMGVEGGHIIEDDLGVLRTYHRLGVRYMTLTHSFNTNWADSAGTDLPVSPDFGGLNEFGRAVVREMNLLGMMVDISHVSDETFWDVLDLTTAPVIASHSSCRALADHPRNLSDEMIQALAGNGGVLQINFYPGYIDPKRTALAKRLIPEVRAIYERHAGDAQAARDERIALYDAHDPGATNWRLVVDHIEHVIALVGADYVGLGADWDGVPVLPVGLEDCSKLEILTRELLWRGHSEATVKKVLGGNILRVMQAVELVSRREQRDAAR